MTTLEKIRAEILFKNRYQFSGYGIDIYLKIDDVLAVLDKYAEQEPTDRIEYGTDGNAYKLWMSNGKEFEQEPCNHEEKPHSLLDAYFRMRAEQEPCDDAVSRQAVLNTVEQMYKACDGDLQEYHDLLVSCFEELLSVEPICEEREKGECPWYAG